MKVLIAVFIPVLFFAWFTHLVAYMIVPDYRCGLDNLWLPETLDGSAMSMLEKQIAVDAGLPKISSVVTRGILATVTIDPTKVDLSGSVRNEGAARMINKLQIDWGIVVYRRFPTIVPGCTSVTLVDPNGHVLAHEGPHFSL